MMEGEGLWIPFQNKAVEQLAGKRKGGRQWWLVAAGRLWGGGGRLAGGGRQATGDRNSTGGTCPASETLDLSFSSSPSLTTPIISFIFPRR